MVDIQIDLSAIEELEKLAGGIEAGMERVVDRAAEIVLQAKLREIQKTYDRVIPTSAQVRASDKQIAAGKKVRIKGGRKSIGQGGKPAWKRTGAWASGQRIVKPSRFVREIITEGPAGIYEARLAELPTGALGVNRTNKAAEEAQRKTEPQLGPVLEQELKNLLGL